MIPTPVMPITRPFPRAAYLLRSDIITTGGVVRTAGEKIDCFIPTIEEGKRPVIDVFCLGHSTVYGPDRYEPRGKLESARLVRGLGSAQVTNQKLARAGSS